MKVTILRGLSGAGKSTYAQSIIGDDLGTCVSADNFFVVNGVYVFNYDKLQEAHSSCLRNFIDVVCRTSSWETYNVVVDNTNSTSREIAPYAAIASAYGCEFEVITLKISPEDAIKRTTHNVPEKTIRRMAERLDKEAKYFPPYWIHRVIEVSL